MSFMRTLSQFREHRQVDGFQSGQSFFRAAFYEAPRHEPELEPVPSSGCIVLCGTSRVTRDGDVALSRARQLCDAVRAFRQATHYAEPTRDAKNAWGTRFAELLARSDLAMARPAIHTIATEGPPAGIFGAVLLAHIDRFAGERRLRELACSTFPVRVVTSPTEKARELAVADIARRWLSTLGLDSEVP